MNGAYDPAQLLLAAAAALGVVAALLVVAFSGRRRGSRACLAGAITGATAGVALGFWVAQNAALGFTPPDARFDRLWFRPLACAALGAIGAWGGGEAAGGLSARPSLSALFAIGIALLFALGAALASAGFELIGAPPIALAIVAFGCTGGSVLGYWLGRRE